MYVESKVSLHRLIADGVRSTEAWRVDQAKRLKEIEKENTRLKKLVADLLLYVALRIRSQDVLDQLYDLFINRGTPEHIRSDNAPEFTSKAVRKWLLNLGVTTLYIEPGSPWENGYVESFIGKFRDELLNGEIFDTLLEAKVIIESCRKEYNQLRPHSSLGYRPPATEAFEVNNLTLTVVH